MQETVQDTTAAPQRRLRGFAAMSPEKKREIASLGGRAAHASGRAHQFSSEEARAAGKKRHQRAEKPS
jgi:general stress protein YciG